MDGGRTRWPIDNAENLAAFAHYLPAWATGPGGTPSSWKHYVVGIGWINRHVAREMSRLYTATAMTNAKEDGQRQFQSRLDRAAQW